MAHDARNLPLLPLVLADVPRAWRHALEVEGVPCVAQAEQPAGGRFVLHHAKGGQQPPRAIAGQIAVPLDECAADSDLYGDRSLLAGRAERRAWHIGPLEVHETVAGVNARSMRRQMMDGLRRQIERRGGVWLRLAAVPWPYQSAFSFRFDHDEYVAADFQAVCESIAGWEGATTHYVCAATHAAEGDGAAPQRLSPLRGLDVGSHGYWHHTFAEDDAQRRNVARGIDALRAAGLEPTGYAAPHGRWTPGLAGILRELCIPHSSEFSLAWDEWPFDAAADGRLVQVPIHPVCLGIALEAAERLPAAARPSPEEVAEHTAEYFSRLILARYAAHEPALLYGHPDGRLGRFPRVLQSVGRTIADLPRLWKTTHRELAAWQRARRGVQIQATLIGDQLQVHVAGAPRPWPLTVEVWRGDKLARLPVAGERMTIDPAALVYEQLPASDWPASRSVPRRTTLRDRIKATLDWEKVTPPSEISTDTWRGWAKHTLRTLQTSPTQTE